MVGHTIGHYRILEKLGEGGMGVVYRAHDDTLNRVVALKVLPRDLAASPERLGRFRREAEALAALDHPNIVTIHSIEEAEGVPFITMQFVEGRSLAELIPAGGLPVERLVEMAVGVAEGLLAAHRRGVIHRDLKPANVMVDAEGRVKMLDFGLAKLRADESDASKLPTVVSREGQLLGTIPYMSPEQVKGQPVDHRTDLFSFGVVLYEMATGRHPFEGASPAAIAGALLRDAPPPVTEHRRDLPREVLSLLERCLEKEPDARVQTAAEVRDALRGLQSRLASGPVEIDRRHSSRPGPWRIALGALAAVALTAAMVALWRSPRPEPKSDVGEAGWRNSVVVLPFVNMSDDSGQEYFCDGLTEELITRLSGIPELRVVARTSAFVFKGRSVDIREVGQRLGVHHVLEGSVRKSGGRVRVSAQLVGVGDGYHLWSETYDRNLDDILAVQEEIARSVAATLRLTLVGGAEPGLGTKSIAAYNALLMGRYLYGQQNQDSVEKAIGYYEEATRQDPAFALAWAGLGGTLAYQAASGYVSPREGFEQARAAAARALAIDPDLAFGHRVMGWIEMTYDWDWAAAEASYRKAMALEPGRRHIEPAQLAVALGRFEDAQAMARRAAELDPINPLVYSTLGLACWYGGRVEEALSAYRKMLELNPGGQAARGLLGSVYLTQSRTDEAETELNRITDPFWRLPGLAMVHHSRGRKAESDRALSEFIEKYRAGGAYNVAQAYAFRGEADQAFTWLERAYAQHDGGMFLVKVDPLLRSLRTDSRFEALLRQMRLR